VAAAAVHRLVAEQQGNRRDRRGGLTELRHQRPTAKKTPAAGTLKL